MVNLASTIHDPKEGMKWMSDKYLKELQKLFNEIFFTSIPYTKQDYLDELRKKRVEVNKREDNKIVRTYFDSINRCYNSEIDYFFIAILIVFYTG